MPIAQGRESLLPHARPADRNSLDVSLLSTSARTPSRYPILGRPELWQRALVSGRVRAPKLRSDEVKLRELFAYCRSANFREVRATVTHFPYLLSLTDEHGFGALHHAEMSGDPHFVAEVLKLYRDPRTFALKLLTYECEEDLLVDCSRGFEVQAAGETRSGGLDGGTAMVRFVAEDTLAAAAGVLPGDVLEAVTGRSFLSTRQPPPAAEDVMAALCGNQGGGFGFPMTLEFRGSACAEVLVRDGWSPCHAAAGTAGRQYRKILKHLLKEQEQAPAAQDAGGCKPKDWSTIQRRSGSHLRRRPLSATPRGVMLARGLQQGIPPSRPASATDDDRAPALLQSRDWEKLLFALQGPGGSPSSRSGPAMSRQITPEVLLKCQGLVTLNLR